MLLYAKPTIDVTSVKSDGTVEITRETAPALISQYGLEFASCLVDDLLREREEIENIVNCPIDKDTLCANLKRHIEEEQSASYDVGFEDGQNEGYSNGYDDARNEMEY